MRMNIKPENRRLLEALSFIDDSIVSDMLAEIKVPDAPSPERNKKVTRRSIRYFLALAASLMLLIAAVPLITYLIPRIGVIFGGNAGAGSGTDEYDIPIPEGGLTFIEHVGEVPDEFKEIIKNNLFRNIEIVDDNLIRYARTENDHVFYFFDKSGNIVRKAEYPVDPEKHTTMSNKFIDSGGNLLVHFIVSYSEFRNGKYYRAVSYSKIVKFDTEGNTSFDVDLPERSGSFKNMIETDDGYIFPGIIGEKEGQKVLRTNDVYIVQLTKDGTIQNELRIGTQGEYDTVVDAAKSSDGAILYLCLQETKEGESRAMWNYFRYEVSSDLTEEKHMAITENDVPEHEPYFNINGKEFNSISDFISDYDFKKYFGGELIEYDDFVLFVSDRFTSDYDLIKDGVKAVIPITFYYRETVYAAYTKDGELIWRTAVDSTNYEMIKELLEEQQDD